MNDPALPSTPEPGHAVVLRRQSEELLGREELNNLGRLANNMARSDLFPDAKTGAAAFAKIVLGRSLGLGPSQALTGLHVVKGNVQIAGTTLAGFVRSSDGYDYRTIVHDDFRCLVEFGKGPAPGKLPANERPRRTKRWEPIDDWQPWDGALGVSEFTMDDAVRAELVTEVVKSGSDGEDATITYKRREKASEGWEKYPRNMLFARAMSNGVKWYCPDLFGGVPIYTEADVFDDRGGEDLTATTGSGETVGLFLGDDVEAVLSRAQALGHPNLSSRATAEMTLQGQSTERVQAWVRSATAELDDFERDGGERVTDAEIVPSTPAQLQAEAADLRMRAAHAEPEQREGLEAQASALEAEAASATDADAREDGEPDGV